MRGPYNIEGPDDEGWFYLSSMLESVNGKYLIRAKNRAVLENVRARLASGELPEPHIDATSFRFVRMSGETPMYEVGQAG